MIYSEHVRELAERELVAKLEEFQKDPDSYRMLLDAPILGVQAMVVKDVEPGKLILLETGDFISYQRRKDVSYRSFLCYHGLSPKKSFVMRGAIA